MDIEFYDDSALFYRLTTGVLEADREVIFVVGAPLTASTRSNPKGVADVAAVISMIEEVFSTDTRQSTDLARALEGAENRYQAAFSFLQGRRGQDASNRIVRRAVAQARKGATSEEELSSIVGMSEHQLGQIDNDHTNWNLSEGVQSLGELASLEPDRFGKTIITSNFDPLIEVSIEVAGGSSWRTVLHSDGSLELSNAKGCHVIHIHGYWHGSDTLHSSRQLLQKRVSLKNSLLNRLGNKTVVIMAYGGWDDIFTDALSSMISNNASYPEIIWSFYDKNPKISTRLAAVMQPGLDRGRVTMYSGIDCHLFLPQIVEFWRERSNQIETKKNNISNPAIISEPEADLAGHKHSGVLNRQIRKNDGDRPPSIDIWVGRQEELKILETSAAKVIVVCGLGGQGKSVLVAKYIGSPYTLNRKYDAWDWRDCREEGDRIRTQILSIILRFSRDDYQHQALSGASDDDLVDILIDIASRDAVLFVFDNVDSYIDLETGAFIGILDQLVKSFSRSATKSRIIITCRPQVTYNLSSVISFPIKGLSISEAVDLFSQRAPQHNFTDKEIFDAHTMTNGHAFWLDLMAAHVVRTPDATLKDLLEDIRRGRGDEPDVLSSIWSKLPDRERIVLRAMAETVRPETDEMLGRIVSSKINFQKFNRSLKSLINLNLIVVKRETNSPDLFDLHPLVRSFVRKTFERVERLSYIKTVISQYAFIIQGIGKILNVHLPFQMLERWSQKAELEIEAGLYKEAFATLHKAQNALIGAGYLEEYVRVSRKLFREMDWTSAQSSGIPFDGAIATFIEALNSLGEYSDADDLIARYEQTVPRKTARYINLCNIKCNTFWMRKDYDAAIEWGTQGAELKSSTNVDTEFDCAHNLALSERDSGRPEAALKFFLREHSLDDVLSFDVDPESFNSSYYGNVGRCLQMMGELQKALLCYRQSAKMLEDEEGSTRIGNQSYARQWIGEILLHYQNKQLAMAFLRDAEELIRSSSPGRARDIRSIIGKIPNWRSLEGMSSFTRRRLISDWIYGRSSLS